MTAGREPLRVAGSEQIGPYTLLRVTRGGVEPTYVTALLPEEPYDLLACGPEPMLEAVRALRPAAQLAWEAPMACGYGACYGCVVRLESHWKRLCIEGPVLCEAAA